MPLSKPTADTVALVNVAVRGIVAIYQPGFNFALADDMHLDLQDGNVKQGNLSWEPEALTRDRLMTTLNKLNDRYCRGTVQMASADVKGQSGTLRLSRIC